MEEHPRIARQREYIERRAEEILQRIAFMDDAELRWTVRVLRDCLPPAQAQGLLQDYSEHLELNQMRQVVETFISRYTDYALAALAAKRSTPGASLRDLTDEELQSMSATEKWSLLEAEPSALEPYQVRRELARLFMCLNFDLFHDPGLGEAATEFSVYLDLREGLEGTPDAVIEGLKDRVIAALRGLDHRNVPAVERVLTTLREAIGQAVGLIPPFDRLFAERMERWPRTPPADLPAVVNPEVKAAVEGMDLRQLRTSLRILAELMSLEEQRRELEPLRAKYRAFDDIPQEVLVTLLPHLSMRLGDRNICDFALRYRSGRLCAREKVNPEVWKLLPLQDKFMVLDADNQAMDFLQLSRHLARLVLTERYELLFDPAYQVGLTDEPVYRRVLDHCLGGLGDSDALPTLSREVTRRMLELEERVPDGERGDRFRQIRELIGNSLKLGPPPRET